MRDTHVPVVDALYEVHLIIEEVRKNYDWLKRKRTLEYRKKRYSSRK